MRFLSTAIPFILAASAVAFAAMDNYIPTGTAPGCPYAANAAKLKRQSNGASPTVANFDPIKQKVDGPCPGLNALANHGYIPHNGVASLLETVEAAYDVFGIDKVLAMMLVTYAIIFTGSPATLTWSIGESPGGLVIPPLLSAPQGLSGSHNKYEGDASATRADIHTGDPNSLNNTLFRQLYGLQPEGPDANFDYDIVVQHRVSRRRHSVSTNPHFFNGPFSGFVAIPSFYSFITRLMSNHSAETPEGVLDHNTLKSFYGVSGAGNNLTYQKGYERIPDNWYKRGTDYGIPSLLVDILYAGAKHPELLSIGGNTGRVNSFAGVDLGNITGGAYNAVNLLEGNNLMCFACQAAQQAMPDVLKGFLGDLTAALGLWNSNITPIMSGLGCPNLTKYDGSVFGTFPGSGAGL